MFDKSSISAYLDLLSSGRQKLSVLSNGEGVDDDVWAGGDRHFEVVAIFFHLCDAF